jgi:hypothetical protein
MRRAIRGNRTHRPRWAGARENAVAILTATPKANRRKKQRLVNEVRVLARDARMGTSPWQLDRSRHRWRRLGSAGPGHDQRLVWQFRRACEDFYRACGGEALNETRERPPESALGPPRKMRRLRARSLSAPTSPRWRHP